MYIYCFNDNVFSVQDVKLVHGKVYELVSTPAPGFAFQLHDSTVEEMSRYLHDCPVAFTETEILTLCTHV